MNGLYRLAITFQLLLFASAVTAQAFDRIPAPPAPMPGPYQVKTSISQTGADPSGIRGVASLLIPGQTGHPYDPFLGKIGLHQAEMPQLAELPNQQVNFTNGNFRMVETDLTFPVLGHPFHFQRIFNSKSMLTDGPLGKKWTHTFQLYLQPNLDHSITLETPQGGYLFTRDKKKNELFNTPDGLQMHLQSEGDSLYTLTKKFGETLYFDKNGQLSRVEDRLGLEYQLEYDSLQQLQYVRFPLGQQLRFSYSRNGQLSSVSDSHGRTVSYSYDLNNHLIRVINVFGQSQMYAYDKYDNLNTLLNYTGEEYNFDFRWDGKLKSSTDPYGRSEHFRYPSVAGFFPIQKTIYTDRKGNRWKVEYEDRQIRKITDPLEQTFEYVWGPESHQIELIRLPDGNQRHYAYDETGNLVKTTNPMGHTERFTYDSTYHWLTSYQDANGNTTNYKYDAKGNLTSVINPMGYAFRMVYNDLGLIDSLYDQRQKAYTYQYDEKANITTIFHPGGKKETFTYNDLGRMLSYRDGMGYLTTFEYVNDQWLHRLTDAEGNSFYLTYEPSGLVSVLYNPEGEKYCLNYDRFQRLTTITNPLDEMTFYEYDVFGNLTRIQQPDNAIWQYFYDPLNRLQRIVNPLFESVQLEYDARNNLTAVLDGNNNKVEINYNAANQLTDIIQPPKIQTRFQFDPAGNLVAFTNANGNPTKFVYDRADQLIAVETPLGHQTQFVYDPAGNLTGYTDGNENRYVFQYNQRNLLSSEIDPLNDGIRYAYDQNDRLVSIRDANGDTTLFAYNQLNRLVQKSYRGNVDTFFYDRIGNIVKAANQNMEIQYRYDPLGRLYQLYIPEWEQGLELEYDEAGNKIKLCAPGQTVTNYTYDLAGRLTALSPEEDITTTFRYDAGGRLIRQNHPNGTYTTFQYYPSNIISQLSLWSKDRTLMDIYNYYYDQVGNIISIQKGENIIKRYLYDREDNLISAEYGDGLKEDFEYDAAGNRMKRIQDEKEIEYLYDEANRLTQFQNTAYGYDKNGNLVFITELNGDSTFLKYDGENKLIAIGQTQDSSRLLFEYDPFGMRIQKTEQDSSLKKYVYNESNIYLELDSAGQVISTYTSAWEPDALLMIHRDSTYFVLHKDAFGNVLSVSDTSGRLLNVYDYSSFGNLESQQKEMDNSFMFGSREYDSETGLYYFRKRYYDAKIGRFITKDQLKGFPHKPLSLNQYIFAYNNPFKYRDPWGTQPMDPSERRGMPSLLPTLSDIIKNPMPEIQKVGDKTEPVFLHKFIDEINRLQRGENDQGGKWPTMAIPGQDIKAWMGDGWTLWHRSISGQ